MWHLFGKVMPGARNTGGSEKDEKGTAFLNIRNRIQNDLVNN